MRPLLCGISRDSREGMLHLCLVTSVMSDSATPWTIAHQPPLSLRFSSQEYWSGLPCLPLGDLLDSGIEPVSPATPALQEDSLLLSHWGSPTSKHLRVKTSFCTHLSLERKGIVNASSDWKKTPVYQRMHTSHQVFCKNSTVSDFMKQSW